MLEWLKELSKWLVHLNIVCVWIKPLYLFSVSMEFLQTFLVDQTCSHLPLKDWHRIHSQSKVLQVSEFLQNWCFELYLVWDRCQGWKASWRINAFLPICKMLYRAHKFSQLCWGIQVEKSESPKTAWLNLTLHQLKPTSLPYPKITVIIYCSLLFSMLGGLYVNQ